MDFAVVFFGGGVSIYSTVVLTLYLLACMFDGDCVVRLYPFSLASHVIPKRHLTQAQEVSKLPPTQKGNGRRQQGAPVRWKGVLITEVSGNLSGKPVARLLSGNSVRGMWHTCCQLALGVDLQAYQADTVCQDMRGWIFMAKFERIPESMNIGWESLQHCWIIDGNHGGNFMLYLWTVLVLGTFYGYPSVSVLWRLATSSYSCAIAKRTLGAVLTAEPVFRQGVRLRLSSLVNSNPDGDLGLNSYMYQKSNFTHPVKCRPLQRIPFPTVHVFVAY